VGPKIEDEGYESAITRSIERVQLLIDPPEDDERADGYDEEASDAM
jgi:hypothetical protein